MQQNDTDTDPDKHQCTTDREKDSLMSLLSCRNMYVPTAAGDNLKLLQLLAMDYSPHQRFRWLL